MTISNLETLIERWRTGDERAAESLYNLHQGRTFRLAYAVRGDADDAEEAAQDALTYALLNIHHYEPRRSKFTTWLHMITVSRCRDVLRKRRLPTLSLSAWLGQGRDRPTLEPGPERQAMQAEMRGAVWRAVQELSPILREAIVLRHWGGHTYREIAEIVGCPMKTAQSRVRLAYQRLKKALTETDQRQLAEETL
ncbi:MAG: RNA polymerase sigma factor [Anaerolineales bacterium]